MAHKYLTPSARAFLFGLIDSYSSEGITERAREIRRDMETMRRLSKAWNFVWDWQPQTGLAPKALTTTHELEGC